MSELIAMLRERAERENLPSLIKTDCMWKAADTIATQAATITELLALIDAHNAAPCPQVFKVAVPAKYRGASNG